MLCDPYLTSRRASFPEHAGHCLDPLSGWGAREFVVIRKVEVPMPRGRLKNCIVATASDTLDTIVMGRKGAHVCCLSFVLLEDEAALRQLGRFGSLN